VLYIIELSSRVSVGYHKARTRLRLLPGLRGRGLTLSEDGSKPDAEQRSLGVMERRVVSIEILSRDYASASIMQLRREVASHVINTSRK